MFKSRLIAVTLCVTALMLASCGGGEAQPTPTNTLSLDDIQTLAVETFSAALTGTALAGPSETPVPTLTASPTIGPIVTITSGASTSNQSVPPTASCYRLTFVGDVSIQDNTAMKPGEGFTKTWKVLNSGSCPWDAGFKFAFKSGEQMNGVTYVLASSVAPNATADISVDMTAPSKSGTLRGDWQMSTAGGQFFGDIVYVQIVVGGTTGTATTATGAAVTATPSPTPETPSPTPTQ